MSYNSRVIELKLLASQKSTGRNVHKIYNLLHKLCACGQACDKLKLNTKKRREFEKKFDALESELMRILQE